MRAGEVVPLRFLLTMVFWTIAGNALLANATIEGALVVPFSQWQGALAERFIVGRPLGLSVVPSCSGLDVMSLCVAAILSYPVPWLRRVIGALCGVAMLFTLNILRLSTLAAATQSPAFQTLHEYVWPAVLIAATLAWIVLWIRMVDNQRAAGPSAGRRFILWSAALLIVYVIAVQWLTELNVLDRWAKSVAAWSAQLLIAFGVDASVNFNVLRARHVEYLITSECITTPLIALYMAALLASPVGWRWRVLGAIACLPLFALLAIVRLLTVALPPLFLGRDLVLTHSFHQIVAGLIAIVIASAWARGRDGRWQAARFGTVVGVCATFVALMMGLGYARLLSMTMGALSLPVPTNLIPVAGSGDIQGATLVMPIFQLAVLAALALVAWRRAAGRRWAVALGLLLAAQLAALAGLGWLERAGIAEVPPLVIRAWALALPISLAAVAWRPHTTKP